MSTQTISFPIPMGLGRDPMVNLVDDVRLKKPAALEELYGMVKNFTFFLMRQLGPDELQDNIHDIFLAVVQSIHGGKVRHPERLTAFLTTVTRFHTYTRIDSRVRARARTVVLEGMDVADTLNLEQRVYRKQKLTLVRDVLQSMTQVEREVLERFYLRDQPKEQICRELNLTQNQFRNIKSQAKTAFAEIGQRRVAASHPPGSRSARTHACR